LERQLKQEELPSYLNSSDVTKAHIDYRTVNTACLT